MALWSTVQINTERIGTIEVQRVSPDVPPNEIEVGQTCTYQWRVAQLDTFDPATGRQLPAAVVAGVMDHPYGSWISLYAAVLTQAAILQSQVDAGSPKT